MHSGTLCASQTPSFFAVGMKIALGENLPTDREPLEFALVTQNARLSRQGPSLSCDQSLSLSVAVGTAMVRKHLYGGHVGSLRLDSEVTPTAGRRKDVAAVLTPLVMGDTRVRIIDKYVQGF